MKIILFASFSLLPFVCGSAAKWESDVEPSIPTLLHLLLHLNNVSDGAINRFDADVEQLAKRYAPKVVNVITVCNDGSNYAELFVLQRAFQAELDDILQKLSPAVAGMSQLAWFESEVFISNECKRISNTVLPTLSSPLTPFIEHSTTPRVVKSILSAAESDLKRATSTLHCDTLFALESYEAAVSGINTTIAKVARHFDALNLPILYVEPIMPSSYASFRSHALWYLNRKMARTTALKEESVTPLPILTRIEPFEASQIPLSTMILSVMKTAEQYIPRDSFDSFKKAVAVILNNNPSDLIVIVDDCSTNNQEIIKYAVQQLLALVNQWHLNRADGLLFGFNDYFIAYKSFGPVAERLLADQDTQAFKKLLKWVGDCEGLFKQLMMTFGILGIQICDGQLRAFNTLQYPLKKVLLNVYKYGLRDISNIYKPHEIAIITREAGSSLDVSIVNQNAFGLTPAFHAIIQRVISHNLAEGTSALSKFTLKLKWGTLENKVLQLQAKMLLYTHSISDSHSQINEELMRLRKDHPELPEDVIDLVESQVEYMKTCHNHDRFFIIKSLDFTDNIPSLLQYFERQFVLSNYLRQQPKWRDICEIAQSLHRMVSLEAKLSFKYVCLDEAMFSKILYGTSIFIMVSGSADYGKFGTFVEIKFLLSPPALLMLLVHIILLSAFICNLMPPVKAAVINHSTIITQTSPTILLMLQNAGAPQKQIDAFKLYGDILISDALMAAERVATASMQICFTKMSQLSAAYQNNLHKTLIEYFDDIYVGTYPSILNYANHHFELLVSLYLNGGRLSLQYAQEQVKLPPDISSTFKELQSALESIEWGMRLIVTMIHRLKSLGAPSFVLAYGPYQAMLDFAIPALQSHFERRRQYTGLDYTETVINTIFWVQRTFASEMAYLTASFLERSTISNNVILPPMWSFHNRIPIVEATRRPLLLKETPIPVISIIQAARNLLSDDIFRQFVVRIVGGSIFRAQNNLDDAEECNLAFRMIDRRAKELSNSMEAKKRVIMELAECHKAWFKTWLAGRALGFTDYFTAYIRLPSVLEFAKEPRIEPLIDALIRWAVSLEEYMDLFDGFLRRHSIDLQVWRVQYSAVSSLSFRLSELLTASKNYTPLPSTVQVSFYNQSTILENGNRLFGYLPLVLECLQGVLDTVTDSNMRYQIVLKMARLGAYIVRFQAQLFCNRDPKMTETYLDQLKTALAEKTARTCPTTTRSEVSLAMECTVLYEDYRHALMERGFLVHFKEIDTTQKGTILNYFERHLAEAKLVHTTIINDRKQGRMVDNFSSIIQKLHNLVAKEFALAAKMRLTSPRVMFVVQCTIETLQICKNIVSVA